MTRAPSPSDRQSGEIDERTPILVVRMTRLTARAIEGTPAPLRGVGRLELTRKALLLQYRRPIADIPEWAVGMIVGGSVVYYLALSHLLGGLLPPTASSAEGGPLVPAVTAALVTWMAVRALGPSRPEQLRLERADVRAVMVDEAHRRVLIQRRSGQLVGLQARADVGALRRYVEQHWPGALCEDVIRSRPFDRRVVAIVTVAVLVVLLLWLGPK